MLRPTEAEPFQRPWVECTARAPRRAPASYCGSLQQFPQVLFTTHETKNPGACPPCPAISFLSSYFLHLHQPWKQNVSAGGEGCILWVSLGTGQMGPPREQGVPQTSQQGLCVWPSWFISSPQAETSSSKPPSPNSNLYLEMAWLAYLRNLEQQLLTTGKAL